MDPIFISLTLASGVLIFTAGFAMIVDKCLDMFMPRYDYEIVENPFH